jgi:hypothetical protein
VPSTAVHPPRVGDTAYTMSTSVPLRPRDVKVVNAVLHSVEEPFPEDRTTPTLAQHLRNNHGPRTHLIISISTRKECNQKAFKSLFHPDSQRLGTRKFRARSCSCYRRILLRQSWESGVKIAHYSQRGIRQDARAAWLAS